MRKAKLFSENIELVGRNEYGRVTKEALVEAAKKIIKLDISVQEKEYLAKLIEKQEGRTISTIQIFIYKIDCANEKLAEEGKN